jgi:hypothetical protein
MENSEKMKTRCAESGLTKLQSHVNKGNNNVLAEQVLRLPRRAKDS